MLRITLSLFLIILSIPLFSQKYTISGYVKDAATGESLIGANVYIKETMQGTTTNTYGFYSLTVNGGNITVGISFVGYEEQLRKISLNNNFSLNTELIPKAITTKEVVIVGERPDENVKSTNMGTFKMPVEKIKSIPVLFGEVDILKTIQLTPGVQSSGDGGSAYYVRGGGPDQNLILLDEATVYNASHLFGFFSVFNADALQNIELTKAGMPANYGGRLASVLDVSMKDGNMKKHQVEGGLGLISSRVTIQGPIKKDTCSYIVSGRRTYADLVMKPFMKKTSALKKSDFYFYDLNAKINYRISDKDRIFISSYFGKDVFSIPGSDEDPFKNMITWGNKTITARWNHLYSPKLFSNTSVVYNDYDFKMQAGIDLYEIGLKSDIKDLNGKMDFTFMPSPKHIVKYGLNYTYHIFSPYNANASSSDVNLELGGKTKLYSHELAAYCNDEFSIGKKLKFNIGLRGSYFAQVGPFDRYSIDQITGEINDTTKYQKGKTVADFWRLEPRFGARYAIGESNSIKASYTQNYQYIHMVSPTTTTLPTDVWIPSSELVKPQFCTQYSLGYYHNFNDNIWETSVEVYYKSMKNLIEYKEGVVLEDHINNNLDNNFTFGKGYSYGVEFFVNKQFGQFTGWIGYTLSKTMRQFDKINNGKEFPAKYDRRHDVSVLLSYNINENLVGSFVWVYSTGNATTFPVSRYIIGGNIINEYGERNSFRMPAYHRADLSLTWYPKSKKKKRRVEESWNFSIYNIYNRHNPYFIFFDVNGNILEGNATITPRQISISSILPSITWNFKF